MQLSANRLPRPVAMTDPDILAALRERAHQRALAAIASGLLEARQILDGPDAVPFGDMLPVTRDLIGLLAVYALEQLEGAPASLLDVRAAVRERDVRMVEDATLHAARAVAEMKQARVNQSTADIPRPVLNAALHETRAALRVYQARMQDLTFRYLNGDLRQKLDQARERVS